MVNVFLFKEESKNGKDGKPINPLGISRDSLDGEIVICSEAQEAGVVGNKVALELHHVHRFCHCCHSCFFFNSFNQPFLRSFTYAYIWQDTNGRRGSSFILLYNAYPPCDNRPIGYFLSQSLVEFELNTLGTDVAALCIDL